MNPVNGNASAQTMLGFKTWRPGHCLECVWAAYKANGASATGSVPTAYDAWLQSPVTDRRSAYDYNDIPSGVPVYFGPKQSSRAGDIVISLGGGYCVATDIPGHNGTIGHMLIADRQRQIGRPFLGWTTSILSYPIDYGNEEPEMDYNTFLSYLQRAFTYDLRPKGSGTPGQSWEAGPTFFESVDQIRGDIGTVNANVLNITGDNIDYDALAKSLNANGVTVAVIEPK